MQMILNLFLSSTVKDFKDYRRVVRDVCQHWAESACLLSEEDWLGGYDDTVAKCLKRVQDANAFMLLIGYKPTTPSLLKQSIDQVLEK